MQKLKFTPQHNEDLNSLNSFKKILMRFRKLHALRPVYIYADFAGRQHEWLARVMRSVHVITRGVSINAPFW